MITPKQLTQKQIAAITKMAGEEYDLNNVQKRMVEELGLKLTCMDVRFLLQDLNVNLKQPEPEPVAPAAEAPQPTQAAAAAMGPGVARTVVSVSDITPPTAIVAGTVSFASGAKGTWEMDRTGRLNWEPTEGEPTPTDMREFATELKKVLATQAGGY